LALRVGYEVNSIRSSPGRRRNSARLLPSRSSPARAPQGVMLCAARDHARPRAADASHPQDGAGSTAQWRATRSQRDRVGSDSWPVRRRSKPLHHS
jgi:hypothetical protein